MILFLLIIIAGGSVAGYWYYINYMQEKPKETFFKYVGKNNLESVLDFDVYYNMINQIKENSFSSETTANFSTTIKNDFTENIDSSKFDFALNISADRPTNKFQADAKVTYSSNDLFSLKLLSTEDNIGVFSEDVLDKYIVSSKNELGNSIDRATGMEANVSADVIDDTLDKAYDNRINMDDNFKAKIANEYVGAIYDLIPEESVVKKENVVVATTSESINTDAYVLNLTKEDNQAILKTVLGKLNSDNELLKKITTGEENVNSEEKDLYKDLATALILGRKISGTTSDLQERIEKEIANVSSFDDSMQITIYVVNEEGKEKETIKLMAECASGISLDVEYFENSKFKITYLAPETEKDGKEVKDVLKGNSIEVAKTETDVSVKYNIQNSEIENKKVVSKVQIELTTNNSNPSKYYKNDAIIKYNDSEGDLKINIENKINFQSENIAEDFSEANSIFINTMTDEELQNFYNEIFQKVMTVYAEKMVSLTFIDNNSSSAVIDKPFVQPMDLEEKQKVKNVLIDKVSNMMGEAEARGETFTIENLRDLQIEGYGVTSTVSADLAIIKINGYTFNIDKDFMLSE